MPQPPSQVKEDALRRANQKQMKHLRATVLKTVEAHWKAMQNFRDEDIERLVARLLPIIQAGQVKTAQLTSVYLAQQAALMNGTPYKAAAVDADEIKNLRGVPAKEVYHRPAVTLYTALAASKGMEAAKAEGLNRLLKTVATDLQMAKVHQADKSLRHSGAKYFRRTLSGGENCSICEIASKHYYATGSLAAIHNDCDCGVEAMRESEALAMKAANSIKRKDVMSAKQDAATQAEKVTKDGKILTVDGTSRAAVFEDLAVSNHGETGPTLHWQQQKFTTAADLK